MALWWNCRSSTSLLFSKINCSWRCWGWQKTFHNRAFTVDGNYSHSVKVFLFSCNFLLRENSTTFLDCSGLALVCLSSHHSRIARITNDTTVTQWKKPKTNNKVVTGAITKSRKQSRHRLSSLVADFWNWDIASKSTHLTTDEKRGAIWTDLFNEFMI